MATKYFKENRAQIVGEYIVTITLVVVVMMAMTVFLKRALQGRVFDAKNTAMDMIRSETGEDIPNEYEPYYLQQNSGIQRTVRDAAKLSPGGVTGVYQKVYDESTAVQMESQQLPPKDAY